MALTYFLIAVALAWILAATIVDLRKREVPDWLNFSLIAIALFARALFAIIENNAGILLYGLLYFGIFVVAGYAFYYSRVFAGGDAKMLMAIGALFANPPEFSTSAFSAFPFPVIFLLNLIFVGSLYGLLLTFFFAFQNRKSFLKEFKKKRGTVKGSILLTFVVVAFALTILAILTKIYFAVTVAILIAALPYLYIALKTTEEVSMIRLVACSELAEGDWLAEKIRVGKKIIKPSWEGLSKREIVLLRKAKKKVLVKYGLPFVPAFLLTLLISLVFGNLFEVLLGLI